jgi:hypothetical protein
MGTLPSQILFLQQNDVYFWPLNGQKYSIVPHPITLPIWQMNIWKVSMCSNFEPIPFFDVVAA